MKVLAVFLLALLCASVQAAPRERIVLLVDEIKQIRSFPVVLAERLGYFNDEGVDVTVMNIRDDMPYMDMLMDGRVDAVMAYYHHNVVQRAEGKHIEAVVALGLTPGVKVLVANPARDKYKTPADLKGSRFITGGAGSAKTTVANALVLAGGHKLDEYTRLPTDGKDANLKALRDGSADLVVAPTPDGAFYEREGVASVFADLTTVAGTRKAFGTTFPSNTIFMTSARVQAQPQIAQHLVNAFVRTLKYINTHTPEEIAEKMPPEVRKQYGDAYLQVLKEQIPMFAGDGRMPEDGAAAEWRVLAEANPKYKSVDVKRTYTNVFVERALKAPR
ncbi:MAG: ABC transporter substrate-binding protein [Rudaea sp.]|uniref:ABC transporter substrate-binding protein n=1 Tax=unclassified Rudaea TaxID=2627037 RepID=UPI0010F833C7|nr:MULTISPECIES: ABC transporter substrate-binding protein [unclassified Rudaea]MBN8886097.1 ABC transporter substrate-binding protein [Rudaea sp.]MBR0346763.1 ABC transporter substrate-binding protein [Rudaea sp.]